jgi:hypothetical protein
MRMPFHSLSIICQALGCGGDGLYFNDLWRFNVQGLEWREVDVGGTQPEPRAYHTAVAVGQR